MTTQNFKVRNGLEVGNLVIDAATGNVGNVNNLTVQANSNFGNVGNVKITGGSYLYYAVTDGSTNLSFLPQSPAANAAVSFTIAGNVNTSYGNTIFANIYLGNLFNITSNSAFGIYQASSIPTTFSIYFARTINGNAYVCGSDSASYTPTIYRSSDGGITWTRVFFAKYGGTNGSVFGIGWDGSATLTAYIQGGYPYPVSYITSSDGISWSGISGKPGYGFVSSGTLVYGDAGTVGTAGYYLGGTWVGLNSAVQITTTLRTYIGDQKTYSGYIVATNGTGTFTYNYNPVSNYTWSTTNLPSGTARVVAWGLNYAASQIIALTYDTSNSAYLYIRGTIGGTNFSFSKATNITSVPNISQNYQALVQNANGVVYIIPNSGSNTFISSADENTWVSANVNSYVTNMFGLQSGTGTVGVADTGLEAFFNGNVNSPMFYSFNVPAYGNGVYPGNSNIYVPLYTGDNGTTGIAKIYNAFANASAAANAGWTIANNPGGVANSIAINLNTRNYPAAVFGTSAGGGPNLLIATTNTAPTGSINTVVNSIIPSPVPTIYDLITVSDPATSANYSVSLYPGNTALSATQYLVSNAGFFTYTATSQNTTITYVNNIPGQLGTSQLPTMTITPASGGNSTLTDTKTVISFGQGTTGPAGTVASTQYGNTTQSPSIQNNFFATPYFLGTTTNVALSGLGLTYYYNSSSNNYVLNTSGSTIVFQVDISFTAPTATSYITLWPIVDFNNTAPGYSSFPATLQSTSNMYPAMYVFSSGGTSANVSMSSTMVSLPPGGTMSLYAWFPNPVTIGSANPTWPISNTKIQFTRLK